jgi:MFS family permease
VNAELWRLWVLVSAGKFLEGLIVFMGGITLPLVQRDFPLATPGLLTAAPLAGILIGAPLLGDLADRWGSRPVFIAEMVALALALLGAALSPSAPWLIGCLLLIGLALGADYPMGHLMLSERVSGPQQAPLVLSAFGFQAVGALAGGLLGLLATDLLEPSQGLNWRFLYLAPLLPTALLAWGRLQVSESPAWEHRADPFDPLAGSPGDLASVPHPNLLASVPWFLQDLATYGIGIFLPLLLAGDPAGQGTRLLPLLVDVLFVAGIVAATLLCNRIGTIRLQVGGFCGCAAGLALAAWGAGSMEGQPVAIAAGLGVFLFMTNLGPNATTYLLAGNLFPVENRGRGAGTAAAAGKGGAVLIAFLLPSLLQRWGSAPTLEALALTSLLGALITLGLAARPDEGWFTVHHDPQHANEK